MPLFSSLRRPPHSSSSDEKDHNSDGDDGGGDGIDDNNNEETPPMTTPLLDIDDHGNTSNDDGGVSGRNNNSNSGDHNDDTFALRIKLNDGKSTIDYTLDNVERDVTVAKLKERILSKHFNVHNDGDTSNNATKNDKTNNNRYLRLIVRGRMMAPDTSSLDTFSIAENDVIHAVLAKEGVRGGQQARMLRRLNHNGQGAVVEGSGNVNAANSSNGISSTTVTNQFNRSQESLWRRIGIDSNGVVIPRSNNANDESEDDDSEEESDFEDAHGEIDLEMGTSGSRSQLRQGQQQQGVEEGGRRRRRRRERRGFDRLRATGMTRDEVTAIRLYFARSVDRYIERRRVMIRASRRLRNFVDGSGGGDGGGVGSPSPRRLRSNTGESTNSLLDTEEGASNVNTAEGGENNDVTETGGGNNNANSNSSGSGGANNNSSSSSSSSDNNNNTETSEIPTTMEGEEILNDRPRMEDEWMSTQGPYSEFRMNLNTSNPLLLAAISGGAAPGGVAGANGANTSTTNPLDRTPAGLFFRSRNNVLGGGLEDDEEEMFGGAFTPNGTFVRSDGANGNPRGYHGYMGPVPAPGSDKDFIWGFILGFFVGFIMIFWIWMPTVPHKQKIGIISGISFQLGLNLLRKSGE